MSDTRVPASTPRCPFHHDSHAEGDVAALDAFPFPRTDKLGPPTQYAAYREARPVARVCLWDGSAAWLVTRYEDVKAVLGDRSFSVDPAKGLKSTSPARAAQIASRKTFINMDDPEHLRLRRMLAPEFMQPSLQRLRPQIEQCVQARMDAMERKGTRADLVADFAVPIPSEVISILLGIPSEDIEQLNHLSHTRNDHSAGVQVVEAAAQAMEDYLDQLIQKKKRDTRHSDPGEGSDLLSRLVNQQVLPGHLTHDGAVKMAALLYSAGHGTTSNQIALGALGFLLWPDQIELLKADPSRLAGAVEEMLRFHTVAHMNSARLATQDVTVGGQLIRAGETVYAMDASANRDPTVFEEPDKFDICRAGNKHLAFAYGIHQCLGQPLARLELTVVYERLFQRFPRMRLAQAPETLEFSESSQVYGVKCLPVEWS
ncbi:cytochrome P450 [Hydrogenophaga sp. BPS33]|uniref:cytochrome P450 n=1 Tax=Hydrogenophaga sp. BPS33 TaxID=2651974 RepID=UPI001320485F|nr:cytochrome P450 [Hydrogenophaga sp. BPS33]QHE84149.1 cytochrome P450 [Hydrogenophaga sp. BPS33]